MTSTVVIAERLEDLDGCNGVSVRSASAYLTEPPDAATGVIVIGRNHRYGGLTYHCAALAESRGQWAIPTAAAIADLQSPKSYRHVLPALDRCLERIPAGHAVPGHVDVCFGKTEDACFARLAQQAFAMFPCPILRIGLRQAAGKVRVASIRPRAFAGLRPVERLAFHAALRRAIERSARPAAPRPPAYDLAILTDPNEVLRPSGESSLRKFIQAGRDLGVRVERIGRRDLGRVTEFDALFIRETTRVDHHTYAFARRAAAAGMPVIDDPESIVRCTNKLFLTDLLRANRIAIPRSLAVDRATLARVDQQFGYPIVLKIPDGSFSRGVYKASNPLELRQIAGELFRRSAVILAQEFVPTAFDWRIGVLHRQPIYACQYFMSRNHWQVNKVMTNGRVRPGRWSTCPIEDAPPDVVRAATEAANLIGDGLYGVDLKQTPDGVFVIEVNDNPSLECGAEDLCLGDELYRLIIRDFVRRIEARAALGDAAPAADRVPEPVRRARQFVPA